jgi:acetylornithine deacetylase/succinyl-diaminopimelate desuccinylase-like protein
MTDNRNQALDYAHQHQDQFLDHLEAFCKIPSISTDPGHNSDVQECANWVADQLRGIGIQHVQVFPTAGHPVVYGDYLQAGPSAKTVLIYGHYDVQPAEPLDKWTTDPFKPVVRDGFLYARGATDMKAQVLATIDAVEAILKTGELPVNVKFMIEGEEEVGSPNLEKFITDHKDLLASDTFLNPDTGMISIDKPTITYALRGLAYFELRIVGAKSDLHSGVFGGVLHNPAQVLCELIAGMHDADGRVTLPGFYDSVRDLGEEERSELSRLQMTDTYFQDLSGVPEIWSGEKGYSAVERHGGRPTLEINGLYSGYIGEGSKTVLPSYAMAKISCRLVPDQDPVEVGKQLREYLKAHTPSSVKFEISELAGSPASISDRNSVYIQALSQAMETVWGKRPLFKREGGSVPVVSQIQRILGIEAVNSGFSTPGDNMHGPDEKTHLPTWRKGIDALILFFFNLGS